MTTKSDRLLSLGDFMPQLRDKSGQTGFATVGVQHVVSVPAGALLQVDGVTYKGVIFIAPVDGSYIKEIWISASVKATVGASTLAIDNYDKSASAARNALSSANIDILSVPATALKGEKLTLTATLADRYMDEGDVLNYTMVCGTQTVQGEGYTLTAVIIVPESV